MAWEDAIQRIIAMIQTGDPFFIAGAVTLVIALFLAGLSIRTRTRLSQARKVIDDLENKFRPIVDVERAAADRRQELEAEIEKLRSEIGKVSGVISNMGSFGERVFKIGMTRRLEPLDRVRELGDASVPFPFDVHALIFTEDAPSLERELHSAMEKSRVNLINSRKEFFRASCEEVAKIVRDRFPNVVFVERPQSQEYLGSLPKETLQEIAVKQREEAFPIAI